MSQLGGFNFIQADLCEDAQLDIETKFNYQVKICPERQLYNFVKEYFAKYTNKEYIEIGQLHTLITKSVYQQSLLQQQNHQKHENQQTSSKKKLDINISNSCLLDDIDGIDPKFPWRARGYSKFLNFVESVPCFTFVRTKSNNHAIKLSRTLRENEIEAILKQFDKIALHSDNNKITNMRQRQERRLNHKKWRNRKQLRSFHKGFDLLSKIQIGNLMNININMKINGTNGNNNTNETQKEETILSLLKKNNNDFVELRSMFYQNIIVNTNTETNTDTNTNTKKKNTSVNRNVNVSCKDNENETKTRLEIENKENDSKNESLNNIDWSIVPESIRPEKIILNNKNGVKRGTWKKYQVETFYQLLQPLLGGKKCFRIVDFGSGTGNIGLALAWLFPKHKFICVDYNPYCIKIGNDRINQINNKNDKNEKNKIIVRKFDNIEFVESRIEDFNESFDICIACHACGNATDYAQLQSFKNNACYIICSCCVGKIKQQNAQNAQNIQNNIEKFEKRKTNKQKTIQETTNKTDKTKEKNKEKEKEKDDGYSKTKVDSTVIVNGNKLDMKENGNSLDLHYPRSRWLNEQITMNEFEEISRVADHSELKVSTNSKNDKDKTNDKRKLCKTVLEIDRCQAAFEFEKNNEKQYEIVLMTQVVPSNVVNGESSPKNDIIVAVHKRWDQQAKTRIRQLFH